MMFYMQNDTHLWNQTNTHLFLARLAWAQLGHALVLNMFAHVLQQPTFGRDTRVRLLKSNFVQHC